MKNTLLILLFISFSLKNTAQNNIYVKDFGAIVNDGIDDATQINAAIATLSDGDTLMFEEGIYNLEELASSNITHIQVKKIHNLTILGAVDSNGKPATHFQRTLALFPTENRWPLLDVRESNNTVVKNFTFDNTPHHATAGEITEIDPLGKFLKVKIFDDLPMDDNTPFTAANVWSPNTMDLKEVPSLTFTVSPANMRIDDSSNRIMKLELSSGLDFLQHIEVGEYLSWHYGWTSSTMVNFRSNEDLIIENLNIFNSLRSALFISYCKNITVKDVSIKSKGNQLATSPRDGVHSSRNKGDYLIDNLHVTGTRLDAFVARGTFAEVYEIIDDKNIKIRTDSNLASTFIYDTEFPLEFINDKGEKIQVDVNSVDYSNKDSGSIYIVETTTAIPDFVELGTNVIPRGLSVKSLILQNNIYENIAGSSEINYVDNVISRNNTHRKIMYPAIRFGANSSAGHMGSNFQILNSTFTDCAWVESFSQKGYISTRNNHQRFSTADASNLTIRNNTFVSNSSATGTAATQFADINNIVIKENSFCGFNQSVKYWSSSTRNLEQSDNTYCACSAQKKIKFFTTKDTFVKGGEFENTNYGNFQTFEVKNSATPKFDRISYLQFDISKIQEKDIKNASILLYVEEQEGKSGKINIKNVTDDNWDENTITFSNKPVTSSIIGSYTINANTNDWISINITQAIKAQYKNSPIITLAIEQDTQSSTLIKSYTKESENYKAPILDVKFTLGDINNDGVCDDETLSASSNFNILEVDKVMVYPNPILKNTNATLIINTTRISNLGYEIYGINGAKVLDRKNINHKEISHNHTKTVLETNFLTSGIYFLKVYYNKNVEIIKFIKK